MNQSSRASDRLVDVLWPRGDETSAVFRNVLLALLGSLLLAMSAKIQVPFYPVPTTLQTGVVFLIGIACGWRLAGATVLLYLAEGAIGLPVFAGTPLKGIGLAYMMGPTGGYLVGFFAAAVICGLAADAGWRRLRLAFAVLAATAAIYALGVAWLSTLIGFAKAIEFGVIPFILGDLVKVAVVVVAAELGLSQMGRKLENQDRDD